MEMDDISKQVRVYGAYKCNMTETLINHRYEEKTEKKQTVRLIENQISAVCKKPG